MALMHIHYVFTPVQSLLRPVLVFSPFLPPLKITKFPLFPFSFHHFLRPLHPVSPRSLCNLHLFIVVLSLILKCRCRGALRRRDNATGSPDAQRTTSGADQPSKMEGISANEISSIKEIEALQQSIISLNRSKRIETLRNKERNLDLAYH
jgi:hypothetical protein